MKTDTPRLPKPALAPNGAPLFALQFSKQDADEIASVFDALVKAYGLQVVPVTQKWIDRFNAAMKSVP